MANKLKQSEQGKWNGEEAIVSYFRPILRRFLCIACPAAFRSEEAMEQAFGFSPRRKRTNGKHDGDDRSGRVQVLEAA